MNFRIQVADQVADFDSEKCKIPLIFYYDEEGKIAIRFHVHSETELNYIMNVLVPNLQKITFDNIPQTAFTLVTSGFSCKKSHSRNGTVNGVDLTAHPVNLAETMDQLLAFFGPSIITPKSDCYYRQVAWDLELRTEKVEGIDTHLKRIAEITDKNATIFRSNMESMSKSFTTKSKLKL